MSDNLSGHFMAIDGSVDNSAGMAVEHNAVMSVVKDMSDPEHIVQLLYDGADIADGMVDSLHSFKSNKASMSDDDDITSIARLLRS